MMAGAYKLSKNGYARGDVLYGFFRPRTQATIDLVLCLLFFLPGIVALAWAGWTCANEALAIREKTFSATPLPLYPFKFVIPVAGGRGHHAGFPHGLHADGHSPGSPTSATRRRRWTCWCSRPSR
jgi:hypothetical protein